MTAQGNSESPEYFFPRVVHIFIPYYHEGAVERSLGGVGIMGKVEVVEARRSGPNSRRRTRSTGFKAPDRIRVAAYVRVSTDDDEQLGSFLSQKLYYEKKIRSNSDWVMVGIYADEAISGTKVEKREQFLEMIDRCMRGEIDMILTKSISRFARNTLDTLNYVRMLKDKNISVVFEKENINTLSMNGELMLTILSSLAQQEVESLSSNVKMGLAMKMQRGEIVGFSGCLGYDYHPDTKSLTVNQEEAETVRTIFDLYLQGYGTTTIARMIAGMGKKNKKGEVSWQQSSIRSVIKNEKYIGDLLLGKTFTVDPIGKRRITNMGEEKMYLIRDHHEPIISREIWEKAQEIRRNRNVGKIMKDNGMRERATRLYTFSSKCECGFCGHKLCRRTRQRTTAIYKPVWQCLNATKNGIANCPNCKSIDESVLESAFLDVIKEFINGYDEIQDTVLSTTETVLRESGDQRGLELIKGKIERLEARKSQLTDLLLDGTIPKKDYEKKTAELNAKVDELVTEKGLILLSIREKKQVDKRMQELRTLIETQDPMDKFDRVVFQSIVEKVIVGGYDSEGSPAPYKLIFILKDDHTLVADYNRDRYKEKQRELKKKEKQSGLEKTNEMF